jgi:predicted double-glycine peptidase
MKNWILWILALHALAPLAAYGDMRTCDALLQAIPLHAQETEYTCGAACARSVLHYLQGHAYSERVLAEQLGTYELGYTPVAHLQEGLARFGLNTATAKNLSLDGLRECLRRGESVIVFVTYEEIPHYAVLSSLTDGEVTLMDPWVARQGTFSTMTIAEFQKMWTFDLDGQTWAQAGLRVWPGGRALTGTAATDARRPLP